jgi:Cdc6-like AAA superfamily ATPase
MELLFAHSIQGAAHDSSARSPPPRCHPDTRIKINDHIITWFYDEEKNKLLIWVYGPAGVGKSAIMQTLADKLAQSKHLGASTFVSRPNGRNSSRQLFITIASLRCTSRSTAPSSLRNFPEILR